MNFWCGYVMFQLFPSDLQTDHFSTVFFYHNIPCTEQYTICQMLKEMTQAVARNAIYSGLF